MKHFIYTYSEATRRGTTEKLVRIYRIIRGVPKLVAQATDTFVSEYQLVMQTMEANKLLPKKAFERTKWNGYRYWHASELADSGIATIWRVS